MSGRETTRGIFLQAIVCLLGALQNNNGWKSLTLEPDFESEKVDIAWYYSGPDEIKAVQVRSSQNQLNVPDARRWAKELENSGTATSYELILIGPCSGKLSKGQTFGAVEVPRPKPLDIHGLVEQSAHRLAVYLEDREKPAGKATTRERVVDSLVGRFQRDSIESAPMCREDFDRLLGEWVEDAFEKEKELSAEQLLRLKDKMEKLVAQLPSIRELHLDHPKTMAWRGALERHMREHDQLLPGDDFGGRRAAIPWHPPNEPSRPEDFRRGCDLTEGLLRDALGRLQEKLDEMRGESA